jgi:hypothetical protein
MNVVEAAEELSAIGVATAPHLKRSSFREKVKTLQRIARNGKGREEKQSAYPDAIPDPVAAAEFFAGLGVRVRTKGPPTDEEGTPVLAGHVSQPAGDGSGHQDDQVE